MPKYHKDNKGIMMIIKAGAYANEQTTHKANDLNFRNNAFSFELVNATLERLSHKVTYDDNYREIAFPCGKK